MMTGRVAKGAKVMFSQASVCPRAGGGSLCSRDGGGSAPWEEENQVEGQ